VLALGLEYHAQYALDDLEENLLRLPRDGSIFVSQKASSKPGTVQNAERATICLRFSW
jgi:hypothetical protein